MINHEPKTAEVTENFIRYDEKSFLINGKRTFLNSAAIHYFRLPREEWREVLVKAKLAGMNCVDTYFAWNVHEPEEGHWDFSGDYDCGAFLDLCAELGLWVIARPGPYICAEWDFGGLPWWLNLKEGIEYRAYNGVFLKYVDLYFDQLMPIIRKRQLTEGGTVIVVQVENEYAHKGSDEEGRDYLHYLRDGLLSRGIEVPLISCFGGVEGTIEGANFWSGADGWYRHLQQKQPGTPKIVTEFWTGWFEHWGAMAATQKTPDLLEKRTMEALRAGYDGISQYMFFGGTNFAGYGGRTVGSSDIFMVTSYDYDAPLNEYGRITDKYLTTKRIAYFTNTIAELLLEAEAVPSNIRKSSGCEIEYRVRGRESLYFIESKKDERDTFYFTTEAGRTLQAIVKPGQIVPVLVDYELLPGVRMTYNSFIAFNEDIAGVQTVVLYAGNGQRSQLELHAEENIVYPSPSPLLWKRSEDGRTIEFDFFHGQEPQIIDLMSAAKPLRIIVLNTDMMDRTWRVDTVDGARLLIGCEDVDLDEQGKCYAAFSPERSSQPFHDSACGHLEQNIGEGRVLQQAGGINGALDESIKAVLTPPGLLNWLQCPESLSGQHGSTDAGQQPLDFSRFGQPYGYLLYTLELESPEARATELIVPGIQDAFRVYVNGAEHKLVRDVNAAHFRIDLQKGINKLQLLVQNMGRYNFSYQLGESKGLFKPVFLDGRAMDFRRDWQTTLGSMHLDEVNDADGELKLTKTFSMDEHDCALLVGTIGSPIAVNGAPVDLGQYPNWYNFNVVDISNYLKPGENVIEMHYYKSPIDRLELLTYSSTKELEGWTTSSVGRIDALKTWLPLGGDAEASTGTGAGSGTVVRPGRSPKWFKCEFAMPTWPEQKHVKLKLRLTGMSKGSLWLNGRDLGRYWQIGPQENYKLPLAWLKETNELILFDEEGRSPQSVRLLYDAQSHRTWLPL